MVRVLKKLHRRCNRRKMLWIKPRGASWISLLYVTNHNVFCAEFASMKSFNKGLRLAMGVRLDTWHAFRKHISLRTKQQFSCKLGGDYSRSYNLTWPPSSDYLGQRGYRGSIEFDHNAHTLDLRVITDESNPNAKDKGLLKYFHFQVCTRIKPRQNRSQGAIRRREIVLNNLFAHVALGSSGMSYPMLGWIRRLHGPGEQAHRHADHG